MKWERKYSIISAGIVNRIFGAEGDEGATNSREPEERISGLSSSCPPGPTVVKCNPRADPPVELLCSPIV